MKIVACIPVYNEESVIAKVVQNCLKKVDEVIVCDDGSIDNTVQMASEAGAYVLKHDKNRGKGAAMRTLFKHVLKTDADIIVTIDGDGQFLTEEIPILVKPILENQSDMVIGYRFDSNSEMPKYRKIGNKVLDKITNFATDLPFRDTQSGFRAYSKSAIKQIEFSTDGFGADSEILVNASEKKLKIIEQKVTVIYQTGNKTSTKDPISHSSEVIVSLIELIALKHPLKFLGIPGLLSICFGIIFSIMVITTFNETRYFSIPFTLISIGSLIVGILLFLMSILLFSISLSVRKKS